MEKKVVLLKPGFMDKPLIDKDGNELTMAETSEYWDDVFDGGIPMSAEYARNYLWPKWGERLGIAKPT